MRRVLLWTGVCVLALGLVHTCLQRIGPALWPRVLPYRVWEIALDEPDAAIRTQALLVLRSGGAAAANSLDGVLQCLARSSRGHPLPENPRLSAVGVALVLAGAVPPVATKQDPTQLAVDAVRAMDSDSGSLQDRSRSTLPYVAEGALEALVRLHPADARTQAALNRALDHAANNVRACALVHLAVDDGASSRLASGPEALVLKAAKRSLGEKTRIERHAAAMAVRALGPRAKELAPALGPLVDDPDVGTRVLAVEALVAVGVASRDTVPLLARAARDADPLVSRRATDALSRICAEGRSGGSAGNR